MTEAHLGPQDVAERLSVSVRHARRLIRERMPHMVLGRGVVRVSPQAFEAFLRQTTEQPTGRAVSESRNPTPKGRKKSRSGRSAAGRSKSAAGPSTDVAQTPELGSSQVTRLLVPIEPRTRSRKND